MILKEMSDMVNQPHSALNMPLDDAIETEAAYANVTINPGMTYGQIIAAIENSNFQLTPDMGMPRQSPRLARIRELVRAYGIANDIFRDDLALRNRLMRK